MPFLFIVYQVTCTMQCVWRLFMRKDCWGRYFSLGVKGVPALSRVKLAHIYVPFGSVRQNCRQHGNSYAGPQSASSISVSGWWPNNWMQFERLDSVVRQRRWWSASEGFGCRSAGSGATVGGSGEGSAGRPAQAAAVVNDEWHRYDKISYIQ